MNKKQLAVAGTIKSILLPILILFLISSSAYANELKDEFNQPVEGIFEAWFVTQGMVNASHWMFFTEKEKWTYLFGFGDGTINTTAHFISNEKERRKAYSSLPSSVEGDLPMDDLIKKIDQFYSDEKNLDIPVSYVLLIIRNRLLDVDEDKIQKYIEYLRDPSDKDLENITD